jgi:ABC-2 type transport system permease protein
MRAMLRTLRWSAWLGWQVESNWTDPGRFVAYLLVKPLAGSLLLVAMYWAAQNATRGAVPTAFLPFLYVGNACYMLVGAVTFGVTWAVISDREHYGMLKYIRLTPIRLEGYLIGRGLAKGAEGVTGAVLTLILGYLLFSEVRAAIGREGIAWGWLALDLVMGVVMLVALGLILSGLVLNMAKHGMFLSEGVAGMLYLLSGAVFPIGVLPGWLQLVSRALPPTYWLEGMRRTLLGRIDLPSSMLDWDQGELALALGSSTLVLLILARFVFVWSERRAWRMGRFDTTTGV